MKLEKILFTLLIAMWIVTVITIQIPEVDGSRGTEHPTFANMSHGGSGIDRHAKVLWLNWAFGILTILILAVLIAFGARKKTALRGLERWLVMATIGCLFTWTWLVLSYRRYMTEDSHTLFVALPPPSAIMLYVLLPISVLFSIFYVVGFKRWILSDEDLADYEHLLARRKELRKQGREPNPGDGV